MIRLLLPLVLAVALQCDAFPAPPRTMVLLPRIFRRQTYHPDQSSAGHNQELNQPQYDHKNTAFFAEVDPNSFNTNSGVGNHEENPLVKTLIDVGNVYSDDILQATTNENTNYEHSHANTMDLSEFVANNVHLFSSNDESLNEQTNDISSVTSTSKPNYEDKTVVDYEGDHYEGEGGDNKGDHYEGPGADKKGDHYEGQGGVTKGDHYEGQGGVTKGDHYEGQGGVTKGDHYEGQGGVTKGDHYEGQVGDNKGDHYEGDQKFIDTSEGLTPQVGFPTMEINGIPFSIDSKVDMQKLKKFMTTHNIGTSRDNGLNNDNIYHEHSQDLSGISHFTQNKDSNKIEYKHTSKDHSISKTKELCQAGLLRNIHGECVEPEVVRNTYLFAAPEIKGRKAKFIAPKPKLEYNIVFVRNPATAQSEPIVIPPPQQKTLVYVLGKTKVDSQGLLEVPTHPKLKPEVYFVNYKDGDEFSQVLPGGVKLQTALTELGLSESQTETDKYARKEDSTKHLVEIEADTHRNNGNIGTEDYSVSDYESFQTTVDPKYNGNNYH